MTIVQGLGNYFLFVFRQTNVEFPVTVGQPRVQYIDSIVCWCVAPLGVLP